MDAIIILGICLVVCWAFSKITGRDLFYKDGHPSRFDDTSKTTHSSLANHTETAYYTAECKNH